MNNLKPLHEDHQEEVPRRVWNQIEGKLNEKKQHKKFLRLRTITGIAACFIVAAIFSYVNLGFSKHNPGLFATNESYKSIVFEELSESSELIYDYQQIKSLQVELIRNTPSFGDRNR